MLYVLCSGCQWRMLPADFSKWRTCHEYFEIWSEIRGPTEERILEASLKKFVDEVRKRSGGKAKTSFCIVDAESVKNTDTASQIRV